jgi:hypothetical protein
VSGEVVESGKQELRIFVTDVDKHGTDVTKMSNFFEFYIQQLTSELSTNTAVNVIENIPIADLGIINEVIHYIDVMINGKYEYVPDFDSLASMTSKLNLTKAFIKSGSRERSTGI